MLIKILEFFFLMFFFLLSFFESVHLLCSFSLFPLLKHILLSLFTISVSHKLKAFCYLYICKNISLYACTQSLTIINDHNAVNVIENINEKHKFIILKL